MQKGISLYPGLDNTEAQNLELLKKAAAYGIHRVFTSLHIPETNTSVLHDELQVLLQTAHSYHIDVISDISPHTRDILGIKKLDPSTLLDLGITTIRCDYGFSLNTIALFSRAIRVQLNASTITSRDLDALRQANADFSHMDALHNFYPRMHTGLGEEFLQAQNKLLHDNGITVGAFIPCRSGRRGPLHEGLPTLEAHRNTDVSLAARHLAALRLDCIFIGDSHPTDRELQHLSDTEPDIIVLKAHLLSHEPFVRDLLTNTFTSRTDPAHDVIRTQESRSLLNGHIIEADNTTILDKRLGDITLDNIGYQRYMGEVQISISEQQSDERTNIAARILPEELFLIKYITPGRKFRFEFVR